MSKARHKPTYFLSIFCLIVILDLWVGSIGEDAWRHFTKPLILGALIAFFASNGRSLGKGTYILTLLALIFSWFGDVFLMYESISSKYFVAGLVSFLTAHVLYSILFFKVGKSSLNKAFWAVLILLLIYGAFLFTWIQDGLGALKIPVIFYITIILLMALLAFGRKGKVPTHSFTLVFIGALFFIVSDSVLAINKFLTEVPYSHIIIMGTYATAQFMITKGILIQEDIVGSRKYS
ncbi:MAG: lysoplasmalogenase [Maribacter sp.]|uniref:lysoplasmalogenase n=1 Tax=Maribacter sp. TaxID=1897614 RepID=UPI003C70A685